eukprot:COSAG06_NODE_10482_length_1674_cov_1.824762_2_plen_152_part_00
MAALQEAAAAAEAQKKRTAEETAEAASEAAEAASEATAAAVGAAVAAASESAAAETRELRSEVLRLVRIYIYIYIYIDNLTTKRTTQCRERFLLAFSAGVFCWRFWFLLSRVCPEPVLGKSSCFRGKPPTQAGFSDCHYICILELAHGWDP